MAFTHSSTKTLLIFLFDHLFQLQIFGHCPGYGVGGKGSLTFEKKMQVSDILVPAFLLYKLYNT